MFYLKKLLSTLILPPASPLLLCLAGIWLARRRPRLGCSVAALGIALMLILSLPWVGDALLASLEVARPPAKAELTGAQAIVILGSGRYRSAPEYGGDTVSSEGLERLRYGAHLARQTGLPVAISGGAPFGGTAEAIVMREVLETDFRVPTRWAEGESRDTHENATLLAPMLKESGITRVVLVTHAWHMRRAMAEFERQGLVVVPAPTRYARWFWGSFLHWLPHGSAMRNSELALHEWLGLAAMWISARLTADAG